MIFMLMNMYSISATGGDCKCSHISRACHLTQLIITVTVSSMQGAGISIIGHYIMIMHGADMTIELSS